MTGLSGNGEAAILTALLAGRYVSLHTADPGNTGASEVGAGVAYARQAGGTFSQTGNNPTVASNAALIQFPVATGSWGTVTHFGLWDAATTGNFLGGDVLAASKAITTDDILRFAIGALTVTAN